MEFIKMHGIGNDFVIIDNRKLQKNFSAQEIIAIADRHTGIGCDQFVLIEPSDNADCKVIFYNPDGSTSGACGNATRCIAYLIMQEKNCSNVTLETKNGLLSCSMAGDKNVSVDMGRARTGWQEIPLAHEVNYLHLKIGDGVLQDPVGVSMGNPHAVFFVDDVASVDFSVSGSKLENHPLFPERANIGAAQVIDRNNIKLRVFERGTGETMACGSGACAAAFAAYKRGLTESEVTIALPGGSLIIKISSDNQVNMTGPVAEVFRGKYNDIQCADK